jgi:hypothetical protein
MFSLPELVTLRASLDNIQILGKDAKQLYSLQDKIERFIQEEQEKAQADALAKAKK